MRAYFDSSSFAKRDMNEAGTARRTSPTNTHYTYLCV